MKTLKHKLLSEPNKTIEISKEYAQIAKNMVKDLKLLESPEDIVPTLAKYGYSFNNRIGTSARSLFYLERESPESKKMIDKIYIFLGMEGIDENTKVGSSELKEEYEKKKEEFQRKNNSMYDKLAWHLGNLK